MASRLGEELDNEAIKRAESDWKVRHDDVISAGGLHIIGTERHKSRRIDNQLRGRSGDKEILVHHVSFFQWKTIFANICK
ncbi:MAG: hypothetical protein CM1200mP24_05910 [Gammaproteobacteria bacterium]|nr:MAG: hypothetical protein CM1200mP24_05910 [Gammaproteobacteria bacterium]